MFRNKSFMRILIVSMVLVAGIVHAQYNEEKFEKRQFTSRLTMFQMTAWQLQKCLQRS